MADSQAASVSAHYSRPALLDLIEEGLRAAGKDPRAPTLADLAPVDHFHTRGRDATLELAELAGLAPGTTVVDAGGAIGGAARLLAVERGCRVTVVDLTEAFCRVGEVLTTRTGLADLVRFQHGNALDLPFPDASFDVAWTQHSSMNIADKGRLYRELARVVRPGGRLALHEIVAGPGGPPHFPVPWARDPAISFLAPPEEVRRLLAGAGWALREWRDTSAPSLAWFRQRVAAAAGGPPPLGLHLLLGPEAGSMLQNVIRSLEEDRVRVVMAVSHRPGA
jgi:SAM-dependent methyltransferase